MNAHIFIANSLAYQFVMSWLVVSTTKPKAKKNLNLKCLSIFGMHLIVVLTPPPNLSKLRPQEHPPQKMTSSIIRSKAWQVKKHAIVALAILLLFWTIWFLKVPAMLVGPLRLQRETAADSQIEGLASCC